MVMDHNVLVTTARMNWEATCVVNLILAEPFSSRKDTHRLLAYNKIMQRLTDNKLSFDLQKLDNKASTEYKQSIKTK